MASFTAVGRLGQDPELRFTDSGLQICKISIAEDGSKKGETNWWNCTAFGKIAEIIGNHFSKGSVILVQGEISIEEYEGKKYPKVIISGFKFVPSSRNQEDGDRQVQEVKVESRSAAPVEAPFHNDEIPF